MKSQTITRLVNKAVANNEDAGTIVADLIQQEEKIKHSIRQKQNEIQELKDIYNINVNRLMDNIEAIQQSCPHIEHTFFGDPSGNNDSFTLCNWCGKQL